MTTDGCSLSSGLWLRGGLGAFESALVHYLVFVFGSEHIWSIFKTWTFAVISVFGPFSKPGFIWYSVKIYYFVQHWPRSIQVSWDSDWDHWYRGVHWGLYTDRYWVWNILTGIPWSLIKTQTLIWTSWTDFSCLKRGLIKSLMRSWANEKKAKTCHNK